MSDWPYPLWLAHRGAGKWAPENTLAAFRTGATHGYRGFECDVKLSADGVPFLLHDATLDRTTSGRGAAAVLGWRELAMLDAGSWHGRSFAGEPLPRLAAIATYCIRNGFALDIEIKPNPGDEAVTGRVVAAEAARLWQGREPAPLLSSFSAAALAAARAEAPHLRRALLLDSLDNAWFDTVASVGSSAVIGNHPVMTGAVIDRLHRAGMRALAYTVNDLAEAERLVDAGIDGLITDAIDRFSPGVGVFR